MDRGIALGLVLAAFAANGCATEAGDDDASGSAGTLGLPATAAGSGGTVAGGAGMGTAGVTSMAGSTSVAMGAGTSGGAGTMAMAGGTGGTGDVVDPGAGAGGTSGAGTGEMAGMDGTAGTMPESGFKPPCLTKGSQLVTIGDSWINYTERLTPELTSRAIADGALQSGDSYGEYAVPGSSLGVGLLLIPPQWDTAVADDADRKFVVMDGGGNDVLLYNPQCLDPGKDADTACQDVVKTATEAGRVLQMKMKAAGVRQGIYFFYPHVPVGGADVLDYSLPMAQETCESMNDDNYHCTFVDTRAAFEGHPEYILDDDIHPNAAGEKVLADLIWQTMKDNCMAQPESSGCCTP